jgi:hypothetical protein
MPPIGGRWSFPWSVNSETAEGAEGAEGIQMGDNLNLSAPLCSLRPLWFLSSLAD